MFYESFLNRPLRKPSMELCFLVPPNHCFTKKFSLFFKQRTNEILSKPFNELTDEEWKRVQRFKNKMKPSVPFSKATLYDCVKFDCLDLNINFISVKAPTIHIPVDFAAPAASAYLCENLARIDKVWVPDKEKACRIVIDAILTEVLLNEANETLMGFYEVKND